MKLTVLGCSGSAPGPLSPASGYLVEAEGYRLVLDMGHGVYGALQRYTDPTDVHAIVVSHLHADHCIDLTGYIVGLRYGGPRFRLADPGVRLPLIGPTGTRGRLEAAYDPMARKLALHDLFAFTVPADGELGPFRMSYTLVNHPVPTTAVRIEHGAASLVYSADTGESDALVELARDADAFLCEASFGPDEPYVPNLHLTGKQAGDHATRAGVGRLLLTHLPPWVDAEAVADAAADTYTGRLDLVEASAEYQI